MDIKGIGQYYGTEVDGKWWKRYRNSGFFARGMGQYWLDERGLNFRRYLLPNEIHIPYHAIVRVKLGKWHAGKWGAGRPVLKIEWQEREQHLISGFTIMQNQDYMTSLRDAIASRLKMVS